jgi:predicted nucleic-acid-binding protein
MLVEDDPDQAATVRRLMIEMEDRGGMFLLLSEVLLEVVWVLESAYNCPRKDVSRFLDGLLKVSVFFILDREAVAAAVRRYRDSGDFADHLIVSLAKRRQAQALFTFDRKLQKTYPEFATGALTAHSIIKRTPG